MIDIWHAGAKKDNLVIDKIGLPLGFCRHLWGLLRRRRRGGNSDGRCFCIRLIGGLRRGQKRNKSLKRNIRLI